MARPHNFIPFDDSYIPEPNSGCWLWTRRADAWGYGMKKDGNGRRVRAHRWSWTLHNGPIPEGMSVLHKCDMPLCVNPSHLRLGTHNDNMRDMVEKGRSSRLFGESDGMAKLTNEQVYEIRNSRDRQRDLALRHSVTTTAIGLIQRRKTWRHLPEREGEVRPTWRLDSLGRRSRWQATAAALASAKRIAAE